jgi:HAD superfamily hydrolase (TIGR01490 family)
MNGVAFYDLDGTLVSSNVIHQYAWFARHHPNGPWRNARLLLSFPLFGVELVSRRLFNHVFYWQYRGMDRGWLQERADAMARELLQPALFRGAPDLVARDRADGCTTVLLTGSLDFAVAPLARHLGIDRVVANRLAFDDRGIATGRLLAPVLAGEEKAAQIRLLLAEYNVSSALARAYSDSISDLAMLESVGQPAAANPTTSLRKAARERGWPILDLR